MRFVPVLMLLAVNSAAGQPAPAPRLDVNGDPLPAGVLARLGTTRFQLLDGDPDSLRVFGHTRAIALAPDGTTVAVTRDDKKGTRVHFLDLSTGKHLRQLDLADNRGDRLLFTPDGKGLVLTSGWGINLIDAATGKVTRSIDIEHTGERSVALSPDGTWLAAQIHKWAYDAPVGVWETKTGKEVVSLPGRGASCQELAFGPEGKRLLLWSIVPSQVNGTSMSFGQESKAALTCIDIATRKIVGEATVGTAQHVALSPDGETIAVEADDHKNIRVRHLPTGAERCVIPLKASNFAFAPDGKMLVTIDPAGRGALWDAAKGDKIRDLEGALVNRDLQLVGFSRDGGTIAAIDGGWDSAPLVAVWHAATGKRVSRPPGHESAVTCMAYAAGGKLLVSGSLDKTVRLWNPATGEHLRLLTVHEDAITAVAFSPDGKLVASAAKSGVTRLSSLADGKPVAEFTGPAKGATALTFSPASTVLFAGGEAPEVLAWEIAGGKEVVRLTTGHDGAVMAFGDGGALALTANGEIRAEDTPERLQVWDLTTKLPVASISIREERYGSVRCDAAIFSLDGRLLASSQVSEYQGIRPSYGATRLRLWERASGQPIRTLSPTITTVLAFSPDGRLLASGGAGQSGHLIVGYGSGIDIWDTFTGKKVGELPVTPNCVAFSPDGSQLATGGSDHAVLIWKAPRIQPAKQATAPSAGERDAWWSRTRWDRSGRLPGHGANDRSPGAHRRLAEGTSSSRRKQRPGHGGQAARPARKRHLHRAYRGGRGPGEAGRRRRAPSDQGAGRQRQPGIAPPGRTGAQMQFDLGARAATSPRRRHSRMDRHARRPRCCCARWPRALCAPV